MFIMIIMNSILEVLTMPNLLGTYLLRDLDRVFWRQVKIQAAKEDKKIRDFILSALEYYLERSLKIFR